MKQNILIIEDNELDRAIIVRNLRETRKELMIEEAATGKEGLEKIQSETYDCIFLDYMMPDTDGISLLKKIINSSNNLPPCPVIMLTGQGSESVMLDAINIGAQDYLVKDHISKDMLVNCMLKAKKFYNMKQARHEAEEKLLHSRKMDSLGQLTGSIAHDFNNILTIVLGSAYLLEHSLENPEIDAEYCQKKVASITRSANRGADLIKHLMVFSRQRAPDPEHLNLQHELEETIDLINKSLNETVEIACDIDDGLWPVYLDAKELEHILLNMCMNARDAMPDGGTVTVSARNVALTESDVQKIANVKTGEHIVLSIADTGIGMDAELIQKIFDPFFTTKKIGQGTGLGLSMVYGFVKSSGGGIVVQSKKGAGTCFTLYLPRSYREQNTAINIDLVDNIQGGTETILVVEDEEDIIEQTALALKGKGYTVITAMNGQDALNIFEKDSEKIDLIFTDISMPGDLNGIQMGAEMLKVDPNLNLIFTTGYITQDISDVEWVEDKFDVLNKPYQFNELFANIRSVLDNTE